MPLIRASRPRSATLPLLQTVHTFAYLNKTYAVNTRGFRVWKPALPPGKVSTPHRWGWRAVQAGCWAQGQAKRGPAALASFRRGRPACRGCGPSAALPDPVPRRAMRAARMFRNPKPSSGPAGPTGV